MAMVCPQCNTSFTQRLQCPTCGVRLLYQAARGTVPGDGAPRQWQQTPWGRILVGLLLAQGLYYGLRQLCTAGLLASRNETPDVWGTLYGIVLLQGLQGLALLVGGALAGAGNRQGIVYGAVVGVWNGIITIVLMPGGAETLTTVVVYGQPILHAAFGALGGFIGGLVWRPLPAPVSLGGSRPVAPLVAPTKPLSFLQGPVAWFRVLAGTAVALGGTVWANVILELVLETSEGRLTIDSHLQAQLVTWEITAVAILVGSALAGATTANGIKQGLFVGLGASALFAGIRLGSNQAHVQALLLAVVAAVSLGVVGGWFGGQLFPRVLSNAGGKRYGPASL